MKFLQEETMECTFSWAILKAFHDININNIQKTAPGLGGIKGLGNLDTE